VTTKRYQDWDPTQSYLLPPSPLEWLPEGHLAFFILDVVAELDLSAIERAIQGKDLRGQRPYDPRMMTGLMLYAYCVGVFSSRRIERATFEDVAFRVLAAGQHPHFTTVNQFRLQHRAGLASLFEQVLGLCRKAGLLKLGRVALDGTKVQANASKHKAMSYERMGTEQLRLKEEIEALLAKADEVDRREDEHFGRDQTALDIPAELHRREARLEKIRSAKAALEQEAREARAAQLLDNAAGQREVARDETVDADEQRRAGARADRSEQAAKELLSKNDRDDDEPPADGGASGVDFPKHRVPATPDGKPKPKAQRNFTDPDSRIMLKDGAFVQAYNAQTLVADKSQLIVAHAVTNQAPDCEHLQPMIERCASQAGELPAELLADSGYFSKDNAEHCDARKVDAYIAVSRKNTAPQRQGPTHNAWCAMHAKLMTPYGREAYARRKCIAEPPFGQIKEARRFRRFSLRGLSKARDEWAIVCLGHNLLKLFRARFAVPALATA
jgi:transposase